MMRYNTTLKRFSARLLQTLLLTCLLAPALSIQAQNPAESDVALRVLIGNRIVHGEADLSRMKFSSDASALAAFRKNIIPLKPGESVQLRVELLDARGRATDVTRSEAVHYESLSPWKLAVTPNGVVNMLPSETSPSEAGDTAVVISHDTSGAWNKIFFSAAR